jgi:glycerophosphoryl diester phosphodiesterase
MIRIAHRGLPTESHENTLNSFRNALRYNPDYLELDIQKTSDNVFILFHDDTLTYGQKTSKISDLKYNEIKKHVSHINTFEEFCLFVSLEFFTYKKYYFNSKETNKQNFKMVRSALNKIKILLDLKLNADDLELFIRCFLPTLLKTLTSDQILLQSSLIGELKKILKKYSISISISYLYTANTLSSFDYNYIMINYKLLTKDTVKTFHDYNIKVFAYTLNTKKDIENMEKINVDGICTDYINKY